MPVKAARKTLAKLTLACRRRMCIDKHTYWYETNKKKINKNREREVER